MTLTFESEELSKLIGKLGDWHNQRDMYVCENFIRSWDPRFSSHGGIDQSGPELFRKLSKQYETDHPKPDWKSLL